jgi:curved DNA-binding protein CbpA
MSTDPFAALGLRPTMDPAEVKRAYFAALEAHPPHVDPQGFRQIRSAYEALKHPDGLAAAYLSAPFDAAIERTRFDELEGRIAEAGRQHRALHASRVQRIDLLRTLMGSNYADLVDRFLQPLDRPAATSGGSTMARELA